MSYQLNSGELYHHGIKGQRWGVRRYQNDDGTLTSKGKERSKKIQESPFKTRVHEKRATRILKKNIKQENKLYDYYHKKSIKNERRNPSQSTEHRKNSEYFMARKNTDIKRLSDIQSGTKKAGRDYMTYRTGFAIPIVLPGVTGVIGARKTIYKEIKK